MEWRVVIAVAQQYCGIEPHFLGISEKTKGRPEESGPSIVGCGPEGAARNLA
jgi:hypothetical protein